MVSVQQISSCPQRLLKSYGYKVFPFDLQARGHPTFNVAWPAKVSLMY